MKNIENQKKRLTVPIKLENELILRIRQGDKQKAVVILNDLLGEIFFVAEGKMEIIKARVFELIAFLSRSAVDAGAPLEKTSEIINNAVGIVRIDTDYEQLCKLTNSAVESFYELVYSSNPEKSYSKHLANALSFIHENFMNELSLNRVAKAVYLSDFYLSHLFRSEMNTTFSSYVQRVRIDEAKELLKDNSITIAEVSERTGFNDANYFAKAFKKLAGITPKEYQAQY